MLFALFRLLWLLISGFLFTFLSSHSSAGKESACNAGDPSWFDSCIGKTPWRRDRLLTPLFLGFSCGSDDKECSCNAGELDSISESGKSPREGNGHPLQFSCLENSMGRGAWRAQRVRHDWVTCPFTYSLKYVLLNFCFEFFSCLNLIHWQSLSSLGLCFDLSRSSTGAVIFHPDLHITVARTVQMPAGQLPSCALRTPPTPWGLFRTLFFASVGSLSLIGFSILI